MDPRGLDPFVGLLLPSDDCVTVLLAGLIQASGENENES